MPRLSANTLLVNSLTAGTKSHIILRSVSCQAKPGQITALIGPNGSGKSTLAHVLMGHPDYAVTGGQIRWRGKNILKLTPTERARLGVFLAFQYPMEISGVPYREFLWTAYQAVRGAQADRGEFDRRVAAALKQLRLPADMLDRFVNEGFSGGEKKKAELLQLLVLQPRLIILDETDSGLDVDAVRLVSRTIRGLIAPDRVIVVITHYHKLLAFLKPHVVYVLHQGRVVAQGGDSVIRAIGRTGFRSFTKMESRA